jgi:hypothetical protein
MLSVPIGNYSETDLMAALDSLVGQWGTYNCHALGDAAKARAVNWLQAKYGDACIGGGEGK